MKAEHVGIFIGLVVVIIAGPLINIWALNTLFGLHISYNFFTWLASAWIAGLLVAKKSQSNK